MVMLTIYIFLFCNKKVSSFIENLNGRVVILIFELSTTNYKFILLYKAHLHEIVDVLNVNYSEKYVNKALEIVIKIVKD